MLLRDSGIQKASVKNLPSKKVTKFVKLRWSKKSQGVRPPVLQFLALSFEEHVGRTKGSEALMAGFADPMWSAIA